MSDGELTAALEEAMASREPFGPENPDASRPDVPGSLLRRVLLAAPSTGPESPQLFLRNARITGGLDLEACELAARIVLLDCEVEKTINLNQAKADDVSILGCELGGLLLAAYLEVRWNLDLSYSTAHRVKLVGAKVGGNLSLNGTVLRRRGEEDEIAFIEGNGLRVDGNLRMSDDFEIQGGIHIPGAKIGGDLDLDGGAVEIGNDFNGIALNADRAEIAGHLTFYDMRIAGRLHLEQAKVGGDLGMRKTTIGADTADGGKAVALAAGQIEVASSLSLFETRIEGAVLMPGARIGGNFSINDLTLTALTDEDEKTIALRAEGLAIGHEMVCHELTASGTVDLSDVTVGGQLALFSGRLSSPDVAEPALGLRGAEIGELLLGFVEFDGAVDLGQATVRSLWDAHNGALMGEPPKELYLDGFSYRVLREPMDAEKRLEWLAPSQLEGYRPGAYVELANAFRRLGHGADARKVEIASERQAIRQMKDSRARWLWNKALWTTTGSGYRNWLAGLWLLGILAIGSLLFWRWESMFEPILKQAPAFNPVLYAIDVTVPVLDVGQQRAWAATGSMRWVGLVLTVAGYALVTAVLAAAAGLLNRDQRGTG